MSSNTLVSKPLFSDDKFSLKRTNPSSSSSSLSMLLFNVDGYDVCIGVAEYICNQWAITTHAATDSGDKVLKHDVTYLTRGSAEYVLWNLRLDIAERL